MERFAKIVDRINKKTERLRLRFMSREQFSDYLRNKGMHIGEGCDISKSILVTEPWLVWIGNNVRLTRNVQLITHDGSLWTLRKMGCIGSNDVLYGNICIGDNTNIGWDVKILPGVKIGKNCIVGAGAIVTKDVPEGSVVAGVPAKVINTVVEYAKKTKNNNHIHPTKNMTELEKINFIKENDKELFFFENQTYSEAIEMRNK